MTNWSKIILPLQVDVDKHRFRLPDFEPVRKEMALAVLVVIDGFEVWLPKGNVRIGIHPNGNYFAIDVSTWLAKQKHLI